MIEGADLELFERSLRAATERHSGPALDAALAELGWDDALSVDPRVAVSLLFELQGDSNAVSAALDQVMVTALGHDVPAVVLPALSRWDAPGVLDGSRLTVRGLATSASAGATSVLVVARSGDGHVGVAFDPAALTMRTIHGADPSLGFVEVTGEVDGIDDLGPVDWRAAVAMGQLAVGHELVGASRRMLAQAREHALDRIQFGRPIAMFQAVRHRLAETLVAIETAGAVLDAAWLDGTHQTAAMAKASCGRGARTAARHCQQVLAGIGFTKEHPFHRYALRVFVLEQLFGGTRALTRQLGEDILEHRQLPALLPL